MGFVLPPDFVRAALPLIAQARPLADALGAAMDAAQDADDSPAAVTAGRTLRRAYGAFLNVQIDFDLALRAAGFSYRAGDRGPEAMWRQLRLSHGTDDLDPIRWEVPGSPAWAGSGHGENKTLAHLLKRAGLGTDGAER